MFCDTSTEAHGFAAYVVQYHRSSLVFAKAKFASLKDKTLSTLELMAVFLALRYLPTILDNCKEFLSSNLYVATDTQVVLLCVLSQSMASKNRLKDIL